MEHKHTAKHNYHAKPRKRFSDFLPLIVIVLIVVAATAISVAIQKGTMIDVLRFFMGYFFLIFGGFKAIKLKGFVDAFSMYDIIAKENRLYAYCYPFIEIVLGLSFLFMLDIVWANVITLFIMLIGAYGVYKKLRQKEEIPCACLGAVFKIPMTYVTLAEDLLMAAMAVIMLFLLL